MLLVNYHTKGRWSECLNVLVNPGHLKITWLRSSRVVIVFFGGGGGCSHSSKILQQNGEKKNFRKRDFPFLSLIYNPFIHQMQSLPVCILAKTLQLTWRSFVALISADGMWRHQRREIWPVQCLSCLFISETKFYEF